MSALKCGLAALGFINNNIDYNKKVIIQTMIKYSRKADILIFGEAFLQGFYGVTFNVKHDKQIAINQNDLIIQDICSIAKQYRIAVSFGFIEKNQNCFYSSQITIDCNGNIIDLYRRVSSGWKETFASKEYCEGKKFNNFLYKGKKISVALCGDLWFDENIDKLKILSPDIVFWPVYTDYNFNDWNTAVKYEYAVQAGKIGGKVLYINSFCKDKTENEIARGGAALFIDGKIDTEIAAGKEDILFIEI